MGHNQAKRIQLPRRPPRYIIALHVPRRLWDAIQADRRSHGVRPWTVSKTATEALLEHYGLVEREPSARPNVRSGQRMGRDAAIWEALRRSIGKR